MIKLTTAQIREITQGAAYVSETEGRVQFHRFTAEQEQVYKNSGNEAFYKNTFTPAGVQLAFQTDSERIFLKVTTARSTSRKFFSHDVLVNGKRIDSLDNYSDKPLPEYYFTAEFPLGEFAKQFEIGSGRKEVRILFPFSVHSELNELSLDDGAQIIPVKAEKKMIFLGDSITHGYDALRVENRYARRVAAALRAEEFNKGIGGEIFFPPLAKARDNFEPDYIVVAYGTNDWGKCTAEEFEVNCRAFYFALADNDPNSKIFALTPIWRGDCAEQRILGAFEDVEKIFRSVTAELLNVICISCVDFVPKESKYFSESDLHPNDEGFIHYADNLVKAIKQYI